MEETHRNLICRKKGCENPVTNPEMVYCSASCAPLAHIGIEKNSPYDRTGKSTAMENGELSNPISKGEFTRESVEKKKPRTPSLEEKKMNERKNDMNLTEQQKRESREADGRINLRHGEIGRTREEMNEHSLIHIEKKMPFDGIKNGSQLIDFIAQSPSVSEGSSISPNLLDDSMRLLKELMQNAVNSKNQDSQTIQAVCNCAKNLREMMKLKLDIYKSYSGK